jgi:enolase
MVWEGWDGEHAGKCLDINKFMIAATGTNIFIDVVIIVLPIPQLLKLSLSWRKKVGLLAMFAVGILSVSSWPRRLFSY